jgi:Tol biopolymer transport system component
MLNRSRVSPRIQWHCDNISVILAAVIARLPTPATVLVAAIATGLLLTAAAGPGNAAGLNGRLAIVSGAAGNDDIVSITVDGSAPAVLTNDPHADTDPAYSPDGSRIAFARQTDGGEYTLWTMRADGGGALALTPPGVSARHPSWSPDGAHLVFDRAGATSGRDLWVIDATGTGLHSIVTHAGSDSEPAWSPDGSRIAFTTDRYGGSDIVTVTPDGAGLRRLTRDAANDRQAAWSSDGSKIAFVSNRTGADAIWTMTAGGRGQAQLVPAGAGDHAPAYSPDGSQIAFRRGTDVWVAMADGKAATRVAFAPTSDAVPSWQALPAPDVAVSQTVQPTNATVGGAATFTISVMNRGTAGATSVVLTD